MISMVYMDEKNGVKVGGGVIPYVEIRHAWKIKKAWEQKCLLA